MTRQVDGWDAPVCGMTWGWTGVRGTWGGPEARAVDGPHGRAPRRDAGRRSRSARCRTRRSRPRSTFRDEPTVTDDEVRWAVRAAQAARAEGLPQARGQRRGTARGARTSASSTSTCRRSRRGRSGSPRTPSSSSTTPASRPRRASRCSASAARWCRRTAARREWRALIAEVRAVYDGLVTYNCDKYQEDHVGWWDAVDVISSSGYYPVDDWENQLDRIERGRRRARQAVLVHGGRLPEPRRLPGPAQRLDARRRTERAGAGRLVPRRDAHGVRPSATGWAASCSGTGRPGSYDEAAAATDDDYCVFGKAGRGRRPPPLHGLIRSRR